MILKIIIPLLLSGLMLFSCQQEEEVSPLKSQNTENARQKPAPEKPQLRDTDFDGVPDVRDRCPGTVPGTQVDRRGCPV